MASKTTTVDFDALPASAFIREAQLVPHVIPISRSSLWRACQLGTFPKPVKLAPRTTAWRVGDVRAWLAAKGA